MQLIGSILILLLALPALAATPLATTAGPLVYYAVQRADTPLVIDGKLDEFDWEKSTQINNLERILNDYDQVDRPTRAKMLWDDEFFYFAFVCQDADMWSIFSAEDDPLWSEEVVEIFIDPDGDGEHYLEVEVSPSNVVVDLLIYSVSPHWHSSKEWDIAGLKTAVQAHGTVNDSLRFDRGWTAEIAIPWVAMADSITGGACPALGDIWRLNLYRIERKAGRALKGQLDALEAEAAPLRDEIESLWQGAEDRNRDRLDDGRREKLYALEERLKPIMERLTPLQHHYRQQTEFTAWSETYTRGFHHPARFGAVQFVD